MIKESEVTTAEFIKRAEEYAGINPEQAETIRIILLGMNVFAGNHRWDSVVLSRTLLGCSDLSAKDVAYIMKLDSRDVTSNNNPRITLGDIPKKTLTFRDLRNDPRYNTKLKVEEYNLLKLEYPRIEEFEDRVVDHESSAMVA